MASQNAWGSIFSVNTTIKENQYGSKMYALKDGSFVAVWTDESRTGADKSSSAIRGQLFNADGSKKGGEFLVNTTNTVGRQDKPLVTVLNDGRFVVAWEDDNSGFIMGRAYQANGTAIGGEFKISSTGGDYSAAISASSNGGFVVSYRDDDGKNRVVNFDANLKAGAEAVLGSTSSITDIVSLQGQSIVFSRVSGDVRALFVKDDGTVPAGATPFVVTTTGDYNTNPAATKLADGRVLVSWASQTYTSGDDIVQIKAQILNANGTMSGGELLLSAPGLGGSRIASVTALADGGFAVAYVDKVEDRNSADVHVASFSSNGTRISDEVIERVYDGSYYVSLTTLADGRVAVSWDNTASAWDDFGAGIHGQILDLRQKGVTVSGTASDDRYFGSKFNDTMKGDAGNDVLFGREGSDILTGGAGADAFVFDTAPVVGKTKHIDRITDFNGRQDKIYLDDAVFKGLSKSAGSFDKPIKIDKKAFWKGSKAHDKDDRIIVKSNGEVLYDSDGTGNAKAVLIAKLDKNAVKFVDAGDFLLI